MEQPDDYFDGLLGATLIAHDNTCIIPPTTPNAQPQIRRHAVPRKRPPPATTGRKPAGKAQPPDTEIRIVGGQFRGRRLRYHGDQLVRPMKHRVREAIFNLIGPSVTGRHAFDLFAGTGALGLEAISRGAAHATLIEKHVPTARIVEENIRTLEVENRTTLLMTSAFLWGKHSLDSASRTPITSANSQPTTLDPPWLVFCSPPYSFYVERSEEMLNLISRLQTTSPGESTIVVESDERFDFSQLSGDWDVRTYPPAVVGIWRKE